MYSLTRRLYTHVCHTNKMVYMYVYVHTTWKVCTIDREIFTLKIICVKNFHVNKFSWFRSICEIFLTVNGYNMDEHLESS